jgi:predicted dehydrogenase
MQSSGVVRWGILGPGSIATRFMRHAREAANAEVVAVGSRTRDHAAAFAATFGISGAHASYEALLDDPAVDHRYRLAQDQPVLTRPGRRAPWQR